MRVFLDFEASSLSRESYPIEVGWVREDGATEDHLIRPAPGWTDWDPCAEAIHGLTREALLDRGEPHEEVARRMMEALAPHELFAGAPSWDGKWLSVLLRGAGFPRHALRLRDTDEADRLAAIEVLAAAGVGGDLAAEAARIVSQVRGRPAGPAAHRALADARQEYEIWLEVRRLSLAATLRGAQIPVPSLPTQEGLAGDTTAKMPD
jgi:hypothetical protein